MIKRLIKGLSRAKRLEDEQGAALLELALCLFMLLVLVFGIIDFSQMIYDHQMMCGLTRQGSDLASRGTTLATTGAALEIQGAGMNIGTNGRIILTAVSNDSKGNAQVVDQWISATGISASSAIGTGVGNPATMPASASTALNAGQTLYVTEVFYSYSPMTPIGGFLKKSIASTLYETAFF